MQTHIVLLLHVDSPPVLPDPQLLVLRHRLHFAVVPLVPQRRRRRQEEAAQQHCRDEGQPEEREGVSGERGAVAGGQRVVVACRAVFF